MYQFSGVFSTPFHIGTWNFAWGFPQLHYTSSSHFVIVTTMVLELCALGFFTLGHMYVTVFSTPFHIGTWNFACGFSELHYTSSSRYVVVTTTVLELRALGFFILGHMHVTVFRGFFKASRLMPRAPYSDQLCKQTYYFATAPPWHSQWARSSAYYFR
jgi:hypothetical protein